tara:strand:+ start:370 stop:924 length:555 start_codon:yes stop_codon:yes gene_type:complete
VTTKASDSFDAAGYYEFDLARGAIQDRAGDRVVVLPEAALAPLVQSAAANGDLTAMRALGTALGERIQSGLGAVEGASPAAVFQAAAGHLAVFGWGKLSVERWGDALCFQMQEAPQHDEHGLALSALLGGLMSTLAGRDVACVPADEGRYLLVDAEIAEEVWGWAQETGDVAALVARLAPGGAS